MAASVLAVPGNLKKVVRHPRVPVLFIAKGHHVCAASATEGRIVWRAPFKEEVQDVWWSEARGGSLLVLADEGKQIASLTPQTGNAVWEKEAVFGQPGYVWRLVVTEMHGGLVVLADAEGNATALSLETGRPCWDEPEKVLPAMIWRLVVTEMHGGLAVLADEAGNAMALSLETGRPCWDEPEKVLPAGITQLVVTEMYGGLAVLADRDGNVTALSLENGRPCWDEPEQVLPAWILQLVVTEMHGGLAVLADHRGNATALSLETGRPCWDEPEKVLPAWILHLVVTEMHGGLAVLADGDGNVMALSLETGRPCWDEPEKVLPAATTQLVVTEMHGGLAVLADTDDNAKALSLETGRPCWDEPEKVLFVMFVELAKAGRQGGDSARGQGTQSLDPLLLVGGTTGVLMLLDPRTGYRYGRSDVGFPYYIEFLSVSRGVAYFQCTGWNDMFFWDFRFYMDYGVQLDGPVVEKQHITQWKEWLSPPNHVKYMFSAVALCISVLQVLSFSHKLPAPKPTRSIVQMADVFRNVHLPGQAKDLLETLVDKCGPWMFVAAFTADACILSVYVFGIYVVNELLKARSWYRPSSKTRKAWKYLDQFCTVVATVGFVPALALLFRGVPCDGKMHVMREMSNITCHSPPHVGIMIAAMTIALLTITATYRLGGVGFSIERLDIRLPNIFDNSSDAKRTNRKKVHPLSLRDWRYDQCVIAVKAAMSISEVVMSEQTTRAFLIFGGSVGIMVFGLCFDKYYPEQVRGGRTFEPNEIVTMLDAALTWHFLLTFLATLTFFDRSRNILDCLSYATPLVMVCGYHARRVARAVSTRLARRAAPATGGALATPLLGDSGP